jgi:hypothetical protein
LTDSELLARLAWVTILPLGIVQLAAAVMIRRRLERRVGMAVAIAAAAALGAALLATVLVEDPRTLVPTVAALYFVPGLPPLIALLRERMWGVAALVFVAPPALAVAFTV